MDTKPIWDSLFGLQFGTVVAWIFVILAIIGSLCAGTIKLYKAFEKYKEAKDKDEKQETTIKSHENTLKEINQTLIKIQDSLDEQKEVNLKQIRHTIVHTCEDAIEKGEISINKLRSLEEMFDEYTEVFHANGYVKTLVGRARELKIIGKLDE